MTISAPHSVLEKLVKNFGPVPKQMKIMEQERLLVLELRARGGSYQLTEYYMNLVKDNPDPAVRAFMLTKMFKHEAELRVATRQIPQAREWLDQQSPEVKQRINERLEEVSPIYREKAAVRMIGQEKAKLDFSPRISNAQGISV